MKETPRELQAVFFDLDGTLVDTAHDFWHILNQMRARHDLDELPFSAIRESVSNGARGMIHAAFDLSGDASPYQALEDEFLATYAENPARHGHLFPGMSEALDEIEARGMRWGVVTNKASAYTSPLLESLGLLSRCSAVVCPDHVDKTKPDPESLLLACEQAAVEAAGTVYVGDHLRDIEAGRRAGMYTIGACYGYIPAGEDTDTWQADLYIQHADQLADWLRALPH